MSAYSQLGLHTRSKNTCAHEHTRALPAGCTLCKAALLLSYPTPHWMSPPGHSPAPSPSSAGNPRQLARRCISFLVHLWGIMDRSPRLALGKCGNGRVKLQLLPADQVSVVSTAPRKWLPLCCQGSLKSLEIKLSDSWAGGGGPSACRELAGSVLQTWGCSQPRVPMHVGVHASTLPCTQTAPTCAYVHTYVHRSSSSANHGRAGRLCRKCSWF